MVLFGLLPESPVLFVAVIVASTAFIWKGGGLLESSAEGLADYYGVPPEIQGSVIVAIGSSAPELASVVFTALAGAFDMGVGAVVGSAIFNILVIPGAAGVATDDPVDANRALVYKEAQFYMIAVSALTVTFALSVIYFGSESAPLSGELTRWLALIPLGLYGLYVFIQYQDVGDYDAEGAGSPESADAAPDGGATGADGDAPATDGGSTGATPEEGTGTDDDSGDDGGVVARDGSDGGAASRLRRRVAGLTDRVRRSLPVGGIGREWGRLGLGLAIILVTVEQLVGAVEGLTGMFGVPHFLAGVTIIAAATSLPDAVASVRSARAGKGVTSLGNVLGSNTFDLLVAIPLGVVIVGSVTVDFAVAAPMMGVLTVATILLFAVLRTDLTMTEVESYALIVAYAVFVAWIVAETFGITGLIRTG